jgi:predicted dehydrogenase
MGQIKMAYRANFVLVGTGAMAAEMMSALVPAGVQVSGVTSRDLDRGRRFAHRFSIPSYATDLSTQLGSRDVDAVYIANAPEDHAKSAIIALEAGKAVLCEKPIATSASEAQRVIDAAKQTNTLCMEGLWTHFLPSFERFVEFSRSEMYGEPHHLLADFGYPVMEDNRSHLFSLNGGGVLLDRAVYLIALALEVFGPVMRTKSHIRFNERGIDLDASLLLSHHAGQVSQVSVSFSSLMSNTAVLACSKGLMRLEKPLLGSEEISIQRAPAGGRSLRDVVSPLTFSETLKRNLRSFPKLRRIGQALPRGSREYLSYGSNRYLPEVNHFLGLLEAGIKESPVVPLERSLSVQRIIEEARANHCR